MGANKSITKAGKGKKKKGLYSLDCLPLFPILQGLHLGLVVVLNVLLCSGDPLFRRTRRGIIDRGLSWILSMAGSHRWILGFVPRLELLEPTSCRIHLHSQWHHLWNQASLLSWPKQLERDSCWKGPSDSIRPQLDQVSKSTTLRGNRCWGRHPLSETNKIIRDQSR